MLALKITEPKMILTTGCLHHKISLSSCAVALVSLTQSLISFQTNSLTTMPKLWPQIVASGFEERVSTSSHYQILAKG